MPVELILQAQAKDLGGGLRIKRLLPADQRQAVGPFVFMDHFGPVQVEPDSQHDVRPHPHIGLATLTYLFEGAMMHRDSLGVTQRIEPGAINWMTAGRGIVHSERQPEDLRGQRYVNHGMQLWLALPRSHEDCEPGFAHTPDAQIPSLELPGVKVRVLVGEAFGLRSPVATFSPTLYLDLTLQAGASLRLPALAEEMAVYTVSGALSLDGAPLPEHELAVLGADTLLHSPQASRCVVVGGAALDGGRYLWWNFVASRRQRLVQAAQDWREMRFGQVPGETESIPLPERAFPPAQADGDKP